MNFPWYQRILKIGYGLQSDFRMLSRTAPAWANIQTDFKCILDLSTLSKQLVKIDSDFFPSPGTIANGTNLSSKNQNDKLREYYSIWILLDF